MRVQPSISFPTTSLLNSQCISCFLSFKLSRMKNVATVYGRSFRGSLLMPAFILDSSQDPAFVHKSCNFVMRTWENSLETIGLQISSRMLRFASKLLQSFVIAFASKPCPNVQLGEWVKKGYRLWLSIISVCFCVVTESSLKTSTLGEVPRRWARFCLVSATTPVKGPTNSNQPIAMRVKNLLLAGQSSGCSGFVLKTWGLAVSDHGGGLLGRFGPPPTPGGQPPISSLANCSPSLPSRESNICHDITPRGSSPAPHCSCHKWTAGFLKSGNKCHLCAKVYLYKWEGLHEIGHRGSS